MRYNIYRRIINPVVANAIASAATFDDDANGLIDYTDRETGTTASDIATVATNAAPAGRRWSVRVG